MSLDTAFKTGTENDYSVVTVWGETRTGFYLVDLVRGKWEFFTLKTMAQQLAAKWSPSAVIIEDKASGQSLIQELKRDTRLPVLPVKADTDKIARVYAVTPMCEAGRVFVPEKAPWFDALMDELMMFPTGPHDDQTDSVSQALNFFRAHQGGPLQIYAVGGDRYLENEWTGGNGTGPPFSEHAVPRTMPVRARS